MGKELRAIVQLSDLLKSFFYPISRVAANLGFKEKKVFGNCPIGGWKDLRNFI